MLTPAEQFRALGLSKTGRAMASMRCPREYFRRRHIPGMPNNELISTWGNLEFDAAAIESIRKHLGDDCLEVLLDEAGYQGYRRGCGGGSLDAALAAILPAFKTDEERRAATAKIARGRDMGHAKLREARAPGGVTWTRRQQLLELARHVERHWPRYWNATAADVAEVIKTNAAHAAQLINRFKFHSGRFRWRGKRKVFHLRTGQILAVFNRLERGLEATEESTPGAKLTGRARAVFDWARRIGGKAERTARELLERNGKSRTEIEQLFSATAPP